ncbi:MAG TPA: polysaccharide deacetylase family protein [Bryobacteraceae bacterium]|nr:polysaccharide deacetylase family protein [Bryobacteraceae bacterium]
MTKTMFAGKGEFLAGGLYLTRVTSLFGHMPARDSLLVLNYHRIGDPENDPFDPGVFSATGDQLCEQISYLKRHVSLVTLEEALAFVEGTQKEKTPRCRVLLTFDDGYLDNYQMAFPILRSYGVPGVFFLATGMVGSCCVPWWDHIAFLMKTARRPRFSLHYPGDLAVDLVENGIAKTLRDVLRLYKRPGNVDSQRFIQELKEAAKGDDLPRSLRRFLNWDEAREMIALGMAIGSHSHSHAVLTQLDPKHQKHDLSQSRSLLKEHLNIEADVLAYPVGAPSSISDEAQQSVREVGYRAAFSSYGGTNLPGVTQPYDIKRVGVCRQSTTRFQVRSGICRITGRYWP